MANKKRFTEEEQNQLINMYNDGFSDSEIANALGKSKDQVKSKRFNMGLNQKINWDKNTYKYLIYQINKAKKNKMILAIDHILDISISLLRLRLKEGKNEGYISETEFENAIKNIKGCW